MSVTVEEAGRERCGEFAEALGIDTMDVMAVIAVENTDVLRCVYSSATLSDAPLMWAALLIRDKGGVLQTIGAPLEIPDGFEKIAAAIAAQGL